VCRLLHEVGGMCGTLHPHFIFARHVYASHVHVAYELCVRTSCLNSHSRFASACRIRLLHLHFAFAWCICISHLHVAFAFAFAFAFCICWVFKFVIADRSRVAHLRVARMRRVSAPLVQTLQCTCIMRRLRMLCSCLALHSNC
jgi:hypothetical protein